MTTRRTVGVEEEFHVVDSRTGTLAARGHEVLAAVREDGDARFEPELQRSMLETGTPVCRDLGRLRGELRRLRAELVRAAGMAGCRVAIAGTLPPAAWPDTEIVGKERNERLLADYQHVIREQLICGTHVHVGVDDPDAAMEVCNRVRPWLPTLLAMSASSPYWAGVDTGYASYRTEIWRLWPVSGIPPAFASRADHDELVAALVATGTLADPRMTYWDVRPPPRYPTVEFRVADACTMVDEAVQQAALCRGLVDTVLDTAPPLDVRGELLTAAKWCAARDGLGGTLLDLGCRERVPARTMVERLLAYVRPALERAGDWDEVRALTDTLYARGTGADRQRRAYAHRGSLSDVVELLVHETAAS